MTVSKDTLPPSLTLAGLLLYVIIWNLKVPNDQSVQ